MGVLIPFFEKGGMVLPVSRAMHLRPTVYQLILY
jgi:hypothetical protein